MPTLSWMGRENAVKATKDVVLKILRENRDLGYGGGCLAAKEDEGVVGSSVPLDREDTGGSRLSRPNGGDAGWSQFTATEFAATATGMPYRKLVVYGEWNRLGEERLEATSRDLLSEFPEMKGFSFRNLNSMRQWYSFYSQVILKQAVSKSEGESAEIGKQPVSQLGEAFFSVPWGHHLYILQRCKTVDISEYELSRLYPEKVEGTIPTVEEIESHLLEGDK